MPKASLWRNARGGPVVLPGQYKIRLTVDGKSQVQPVTITPNPNLTVTQAELKQQYDLVSAINRDFNRVQTAVLELRALHQQLGDVRKAAADKPALVSAADAVEAKATAVEDVLIQVKNVAPQDPLNYPIRLNNMLISLASTVSQGDTAPAQQHHEEYAKLKAVADQQLAAWEQIKAGDLAQLNGQLSQQGVAPVKLVASVQLERDRAEALASWMPEDEQVGMEH